MCRTQVRAGESETPRSLTCSSLINTDCCSQTKTEETTRYILSSSDRDKQSGTTGDGFVWRDHQPGGGNASPAASSSQWFVHQLTVWRIQTGDTKQTSDMDTVFRLKTTGVMQCGDPRTPWVAVWRPEDSENPVASGGVELLNCGSQASPGLQTAITVAVQSDYWPADYCHLTHRSQPVHRQFESLPFSNRFLWRLSEI